jgi:phosphoglycerate dehydrogenase-like enzyme
VPEAARSGHDLPTTPPTVVLWVGDPGVYRRAVEACGLEAGVEIHETLPRQVPPDGVVARCAALLAWRVPEGMLGRMPRLRWIQALTAGVERWLSRADLPSGVQLTCARGTHRIQMPENILGALFHLTKPFTAAALDQREHRWAHRVSEPLAGKTLGILGLGAIGQEVARKAGALQLRVVGTKRVPVAVPGVARVYPPEASDEVLAQSDFVVVLLPVTRETRDFLDAARLRRMRRTAYLLNFARGELVVDQDLVAAVREGVIAGAVLDVFRTEPLPAGHPFWTTTGITVLPHIGGLHPQQDDAVAALFAENLGRFLRGAPLLHLVDRERGY